MTLFFSLEGQGTVPYKIHQRVQTTLNQGLWFGQLYGGKPERKK
jgi:hypothetical protein